MTRRSQPTTRSARRCAWPDLLEDVQALPAGLQTELITNGLLLSHGQLIRLMIARAVASREDELKRNYDELIAAGQAPSAAAKQIAQRFGLNKREAYKLGL